MIDRLYTPQGQERRFADPDRTDRRRPAAGRRGQVRHPGDLPRRPAGRRAGGPGRPETELVRRRAGPRSAGGGRRTGTSRGDSADGSAAARAQTSRWTRRFCSVVRRFGDTRPRRSHRRRRPQADFGPQDRATAAMMNHVMHETDAAIGAPTPSLAAGAGRAVYVDSLLVPEPRSDGRDVGRPPCPARTLPSPARRRRRPAPTRPSPTCPREPNSAPPCPTRRSVRGRRRASGSRGRRTSTWSTAAIATCRWRWRQDWQVRGLEPEDTVAHFDTLDGRTLVEPSNRVYLYAPRFGSVRKVVSLVQDEQTDRVSDVHRPVAPVRCEDVAEAATSKQQIQPGRNIGARPPVIYEGRQRDGALVLAARPGKLPERLQAVREPANHPRGRRRGGRRRATWPRASPPRSPGRTTRRSRSFSTARRPPRTSATARPGTIYTVDQPPAVPETAAREGGLDAVRRAGRHDRLHAPLRQRRATSRSAT